MAIQLTSPWADIGSGVGQGVGSAINYLISNRANRMADVEQQKQIRNAFQTINAPTWMADFVNSVPQEQRWDFATNLMQSGLTGLPQSSTGQPLPMQSPTTQALQTLAAPSMEAERPSSIDKQRLLKEVFGGTFNVDKYLQDHMKVSQPTPQIAADTLRKAAVAQPAAVPPTITAKTPPAIAPTPMGPQPLAAPQKQVQPELPGVPLAPIERPRAEIVAEALSKSKKVGETPAQQLARERHELAKEKQLEVAESRKQKQIETKNKEELSDFNDILTPARELFDASKDALLQLRSGKTVSGVTGALTPESELFSFAQSPETQQLIKDYNRIVTQKSSLLGGRQTDASRKLIKSGKPSLGQDFNVQEKLVLENMEQGGEIMAREKIKDFLTVQNEDKQPANLRGKMNARWTDIQKELAKHKDAPNGQEAETDEGIVFKKFGNKWFVWG